MLSFIICFVILVVGYLFTASTLTVSSIRTTARLLL